MRKRAVLSWLVVGAVAWLVLSCGGAAEVPVETALLERPSPGRDVILVTVDTLRHDAVGYSGSGLAETPAIDRAAATAAVFDVAHAHAVVTLPSHASILTGLYPYDHGIRENAGFVLADGVPTLAERFREAGYRTAAFVSAFTLDRRFGLDRGFETYDDRYEGHGTKGFTPAERPGDETVGLALDWWDAHRGEPRFLWLHVFTPHFPYEPREPFASRHPEQPYFGDVEMADAEIAPLLGRVLDGPDDDTLLVVTSDHGEGLGEHGEATHGIFAYEATLRVPLFVRCAGLVSPGRVERPARHVDLVPTVLDLAALPVPDDLPGRSLFAQTTGAREEGSYFEAMSTHLNRGWAPLRGRVVGGAKAIELPIPELYDLVDDPRETTNLADDDPSRLREILRGLPEFRDPSGRRSELDEEVVARLRSLGYAAGVADTADRRDDPAFDPKNLVYLDRLLDQAIETYRRGEVDEAIAKMRELIDRQPSLSLAYAHLAYFLQDLGRGAEAVEVLRSALAAGAGNESVRRKLALALIRQGQAAEAREIVRGLEDSFDPETQSAIGRVEATLGNDREAERRFETALRIDPSFPVAHMDLGILHLGAGRIEEARVELEQALDADPYLAEAWNGLAVARLQTGDEDGAIEAWNRAIEVDPRMRDALFNLALVLGRRGDREGAEEALRRYADLVQGDEREEALSMLRALDERAR